MGAKQKAKIETLENEKLNLTQRILELEGNLLNVEKSYKSQLDLKNKEFEINELGNKQEFDAKVSELETGIKLLNETIEEKQKQLDRKELKKLAQAYSEQEASNKEDSDKWFKRLVSVAWALVISAFVSIIVTHNQTWIESVKYYVVDLILISAVFFCSSQYSNTIMLKNDYANRKTLAQSFHNILNSLNENADIKSSFIEKAVGVLCAPNITGVKEPLLSKKVLKDIAEIIGSATNK